MGPFVIFPEGRLLTPWIMVSQVVFVEFMSRPIVSKAFVTSYLRLVKNIIIVFIEAVNKIIVETSIELRLLTIIMTFHVIQCIFEVVCACDRIGQS